MLEVEESEPLDDKIIKLVLRELLIRLEYIPKRNIISFRKTICRKIVVLNNLNHRLLHFPEENSKQLDQNEIIQILINPGLLSK
jgi:hypothetical protein